MDSYCAVLSFHDGLCKRKPQDDALCILGFAAAVESLDDMMDIFGCDALSVV